MQQSAGSDAEGRDGGRDDHGARVAFLGNSILYFNDTPRFLVNLGKGSIAHQDSCLRGGTNLSQLWSMGNGMKRHGFATEAAKIGTTDDGNAIYDVGAPNVRALLGWPGEKKWQYVVFNDHTQGPAREDSREATIHTLLERYLPLLIENGATPIIVETAAYRYPDINNSHDLGSTEEFQRRVREGADMYVEALKGRLPKDIAPRLAPVGSAYLHVYRNNRAVWEGLFDPRDNFHPSPSGTFLQCCVIHCVMFGSPPPLPATEREIEALWANARTMYSENPPRLPTVEEARYLWDVARVVCGTEAEPASSL